MDAKAKHKSLLERDFRHLYFTYFGTLISGKKQEIDIFRICLPEEDEGSSPLDVEIRVTLNRTTGSMQFSCIALSDHKGAPVILTTPRGRAINDEEVEVCLWEAIEHDDRHLDYSYGRLPLGTGVKPGTLITPAPPELGAPEIA